MKAVVSHEIRSSGVVKFTHQDVREQEELGLSFYPDLIPFQIWGALPQNKTIVSDGKTFEAMVEIYTGAISTEPHRLGVILICEKPDGTPFTMSFCPVGQRDIVAAARAVEVVGQMLGSFFLFTFKQNNRVGDHSVLLIAALRQR